MKISEREDYHRLAFSEKENFLRFVYGLGEDGLKRLFRFPGQNFSLWWFSLVAEKPPFKTDSYENLIDFLLHKKHRQRNMTLKRRIRTNPLCGFFRGYYDFFRFLFRALYIKSYARDFNKRKEDLSRRQYHIVSYFPLINDEAAKKGIFENEYLLPFHRILEREARHDYSHILLYVFLNGRKLRDSVNLARRFVKAQSIFFLEEFFKLSRVFKFLFYYAYFSGLFVLNLPGIKKKFIYKYEGKDYNVWNIFKGDMYSSFCGPVLASSILHILVFEELTRHLKEGSKVIAVCEMQWWERALYIYAGKMGITTIGFQHTLVPELILNYFNDPREIGGEDFVAGCPLPDYMATSGKTIAEIFVKHGWPSERVFVWGAQRFESLKDAGSHIVPWKDREDYFICAFSIHTTHAKKILSLFEDAFRHGAGYKILLKGHPSMDLRKIASRTGVKLDPGTFTFTDSPIPEIIKRAKGIMVTESSCSFFALACGIPVIVLRIPDQIDCNPLSYVTDIPFYAYSPEGLRSLCDRIIASKEPPVSLDKCREILNRYMHFSENENEYFDKIAALDTARGTS